MIQCPSCNNKNDDGAKFCQKCGSVLVRAPGSDDDDQVGKIIAGKFRIEKLIGEGGMGKVFRATQMSLDKTVVLKVLRTSLLGDARTVARFQREAKAASRLNHPNSISVIDFGQSDDGSLYIAMEYVAGEDLHQLLSREGPLPQKRICRIAGQVLSALADAHAAGVIHRDLKPENIMVEQRRGEPDFVKVLDFGIAKIQETDGHGDGQALTRAGFVCGTPEYMSPEQARGLQLDARTDLYAVGVIMYQCATNQLPFEADSAVALATMHLTTPPQPPREKRSDAPISDGMETLILRAMEKDPALRPATAEDFRRDLLSIENEFDNTRVQTIPPAVSSRNSGALRRVSKNGHGNKHPSAHPVAPAAPSEASMPTWSSSPGSVDDQTSITGDAGPPPARRAPKGQTSTVAIFVGALLGTAFLAGGALFAYDRFVRKDVPEVVVEDPPQPTPPTTKPPPENVNLVHEQPTEDQKKEKARKNRELVALGDQSLAKDIPEAALEYYLKAYDADAPSPALIKRIAAVHLMQGRGVDAANWVSTYAKLKDPPPDAALFVAASQLAPPTPKK